MGGGEPRDNIYGRINEGRGIVASSERAQTLPKAVSRVQETPRHKEDKRGAIEVGGRQR